MTYRIFGYLSAGIFDYDVISWLGPLAFIIAFPVTFALVYYCTLADERNN